MPSATMEEYLEAIYKLAEEGSVRPSQIAETLSVSQPTVTATLKRLKAQGLVTRPDNAVALTSAGRRQALDIIRRHRLAERLLVDVLGLSWDEVHEEACRLEHALSPRIQRALEEYLEQPDVCPHGHPIPSESGEIAVVAGTPLSSHAAGESVEVLRVAEGDDELLTYLASLGLFPGTEVEIMEVAPFKGPLLVDVGGSRYAIGREVATKIVVRPLAKG